VSHSLFSDNAAEHCKRCEARWTPPPQVVGLALEARLQQIPIGLAKVDIQIRRTEAHSLRGSAVELGADNLAEVCQGPPRLTEASNVPES